MESRDQGRGEGGTGQRLERLERELAVYRRLYRGAIETLKAARRREAMMRRPSATS